MNLRAYRFLDVIWQSLSVAASIWVIVNVWQIGIMVFFISMGIAQTTSLLVHLMSKDAQITLVRKWLHRAMYLAFGLLILQIIIMQLSAAVGYITLIIYGIYTSLLMILYYINSWAEALGVEMKK
ncbi:MAG: hypothetical protein N2167_05400 [Flavobacteriales bacterium]|nr:hypothetical protein [Flavobacteriales bacterium]